MRRDQIKVGGEYAARISGKHVTVRVTSIRSATTYRGRGTVDITVFDVFNLATGRKTTFKSAARFRHEVKVKVKTVLSFPGDADVELDGPEGEQRADFTPAVVPTEIATTSLRASRGVSRESAQRATVTTPETMETTTSKQLETDDAPLDEFAADMAAQANGVAAPAPAYDGDTVAGYTPTAEQAEVIRIARQPGLKVLVIEAGAGTGKTSTLRMLEEVLPGAGQYTAFNKSLVSESKTKFKKASCKTSHGLAFAEEGRRFAKRLRGPRARGIDVAHTLGIREPLVLDLGPNPKHNPADPKSPARLAKYLQPDQLAAQVMLAVRKFSQSADPEVTERHFKYVDGIDAHGADGGRTYANNERMRKHLLPFARAAWADYNDPNGALPGYQHDFYVKTWQLGDPYIAAAYILLDESQDVAPVLADIIRRQTHALVILVGDSCQRIYGWRGAVSAAEQFPDAPRTYLSQSFRFGPNVAAVANAVLATLPKPVKLRLKGLPSIASHVYVDRPSPLPPTCVLCRTNAAAVAGLLAANAEGKRCHLVGGGADVVAFVKAALELQDGRSTSHPDLSCFESWNEVVAYVKEDEGEDLKLLVKLVEEFGCRAILGALENMPKEDRADRVFCTAHKSKGREWLRVKLASDFPSADKMCEEDTLLLYVAATRAKHVLDLSECPPFAGGKRRAAEGRNGEGGDLPVILVNVVNPEGEPRADADDAKPMVTYDATENVTTEEREAAEQPAPAGNGNGRGALTTFSWAKLRDGSWGIRGPQGTEAGTRVEVERKNGTRSTETVVEMVGRFADGALYRVRSSR